jgi:hypothetical protein
VLTTQLEREHLHCEEERESSFGALVVEKIKRRYGLHRRVGLTNLLRRSGDSSCCALVEE